MKEIQDFTDKQAFIDFLASRPEKSKAYPDIQYDELYDIAPGVWCILNQYTISFNGYNKFFLQMHPETNELFLGDMNDSGHATRTRIIKIHRSDIFTRQAWLEEWYEFEKSWGRPLKFWLT
ncbi:hypothetical protein A3860_17150 [Niastella vici]|uniref:Uncharacterized protein n=1 Tax=Niastella vici TaxID=1703345 RepID=A0A1V9G495_9BACT|nr:hypothetical protein [Niastella vici]OQP65392.1 hypothetical protein A3860_17150 [Niastella vici]